MPDWFQTFDESLWLAHSGPAQEEAQFLRRALHLRRGQHVLDCPCGDGRLAVPLARMGCRVTGVDFGRTFLARMRRELRRRKLTARTICADMRRIDFDGEFHAAINYFGSFGYFSEEQNLDFLARLARSLRPGGRLLIDQPNRQFILRHFVRRMKLGDMTVFPTYNRRAGRLEATWVIHGKKHRSSIRAYTLAEFRAMFARAGLELEAAYGSIAGETYGPASQRLIVVAKKLMFCHP